MLKKRWNEQDDTCTQSSMQPLELRRHKNTNKTLQIAKWKVQINPNDVKYSISLMCTFECVSRYMYINICVCVSVYARFRLRKKKRKFSADESNSNNCYCSFKRLIFLFISIYEWSLSLKLCCVQLFNQKRLISKQ